MFVWISVSLERKQLENVCPLKKKQKIDLMVIFNLSKLYLILAKKKKQNGQNNSKSVKAHCLLLYPNLCKLVCCFLFHYFLHSNQTNLNMSQSNSKHQRGPNLEIGLFISCKRDLLAVNRTDCLPFRLALANTINGQ